MWIVRRCGVEDLPGTYGTMAALRAVRARASRGLRARSIVGECMQPGGRTSRRGRGAGREREQGTARAERERGRQRTGRSRARATRAGQKQEREREEQVRRHIRKDARGAIGAGGVVGGASDCARSGPARLGVHPPCSRWEASFPVNVCQCPILQRRFRRLLCSQLSVSTTMLRA